MSELLKATIQTRKVNKGSQAFILVPSKNGQREQSLGGPILASDLANLLLKDAVKLNGVEVEYEIEAGLVKRIRRAGQAWEGSASPAPKPKTQGNFQGLGDSAPGSQFKGKPNHPPMPTGPKFENPYNFIPTPPRPARDTPLGDAQPPGHHRYHADHWTGRIGVTLTTKTPLLIPDAARLERLPDEDHSVLPLRLGPDGSPYLPPTSVKGMLRSAYEAVTNSRMGVFGTYDAPLALRYPAQGGAQVVPVRVINGGRILELLPGTSQIGTDGSPVGTPPLVYAAWLPRYGSAARYLRRNVHLAVHGEPVWAEIELWEHQISKRNSTAWTNNFNFWRAVALEPDSNRPPSVPLLGPTAIPNRPTAEYDRFLSYSTPSRGAAHRWVRGWVFISNLNIDRKHDERVFFVEPGHRQVSALHEPLSNEIHEQWRALIANYQEGHREEIAQGITHPPALRDHCLWSRQIVSLPAERELADGTLCYAKVEARKTGGFEVKALYPVMISRDLYRLPPSALVAAELTPARCIADLSPADRLFGWVKGRGRASDGAVAFRGQLRVGPITCKEGAAAVADLTATDEYGLPLSILGEPKPQQERFYVARDRKGQPLPSGSEAPKGSGYATKDQGLRGRKVYPHQRRYANQPGYWSAQPADQEFRRLPDPEHHGRTRDNQNRSVREWVTPGTHFEFEIQVTNLSAAELGALLWLLSLGDDHYLRLGLGKPLGFGSIHLEIASIDLRDGAALATDYLSLLERGQTGQRVTGIADQPLTDVIGKFMQAVELANGAQPFEKVSFIAAFIAACKGSGLPVHYPRTTELRTGGTKVYEWFVKNEDGGKGARLALPALTAQAAQAAGLPYLK